MSKKPDVSYEYTPHPHSEVVEIQKHLLAQDACLKQLIAAYGAPPPAGFPAAPTQAG